MSQDAPRVVEGLIPLLRDLCDLAGAPGDEGLVRKRIQKEVKPYVDEIQVDSIGNLICVKRAKKKAKMKVMAAAHMDEVGFMIVKTSEDEFSEFRVMGGIDPRVLPAAAVLIGADGVPGVISPRTAHLTTDEEQKSIVPVDRLQITVGTANKKKVQPGAYAVFDTRFERWGDRLVAKALDDRVGCVNLIHLLQREYDEIDLYGVFTVQEELGLRGAGLAAYRIQPDAAFVFDTTPSADPPLWEQGAENHQYNALAGKGPVIYTMDTSQIYDQRMIRFVSTIAEENCIPCQFRQPGPGGTDSGAIHLQHSGTLSQSISVPVRYLHSPRSMMRLDDWENTLRLLCLTFEQLQPTILCEEKA